MSNFSSSNLTSPTNALTGGNFSGCWECPDGTVFEGDSGLGALETLTKNIMAKTPMRFNGPKFPLGELPTKKASSPRLGGEDGTVLYNFHIPNIEEYMMYDVEGSEAVQEKLVGANGICGPEEMMISMFDLSSIGCNPPRGKGGVMGKDFAGISRKAAPLEMGPFCVTQFQNFDHLAEIFSLMMDEYPNAAMQMLTLQRIRDFVANSHRLAACSSGQTGPDFSAHFFKHRPDSAGNIHWLFEFIDQIVAEADSNRRDGFKICMSARLWKHWIREEAARLGVNIELAPCELYKQIPNCTIHMENEGMFKLKTERSNVTVTVYLEADPVYVIDRQVGVDQYEWQFQPWFISRPGDDSRPGEAGGLVRRKNPLYGKACNLCPEGEGSLTEFVFMYQEDESHCYEAFPSNPFAGTEGFASNVRTDLQDLWGSMKMDMFFGTEVDEYFLKPLFKGHHTCPSNIDRTWFAGRMWFGEQTRLLNKYAQGVAAFKVPFTGEVTGTVECCPVEAFKTPIVLSAKETQVGPPLCVEAQEVEPGEAGCIKPSCELTFQVPPEGETTEILVPLRRADGVVGELTVSWTVVDDTAVNGSDFTLDATGDVTFPEGVTEACVPIEVAGAACTENGDCKKFSLSWSGEDICESACTSTEVRLLIPKCAEDGCDVCDEATTGEAQGSGAE